MATTRYEYRVIYGDTDQAGIVYHANLLRWFEGARCEYLRARSGSYSAMNRQGVHFPVVEAVCRYHRPVRFEDEVVVEVEVATLGRASVRFAYRVFTNDEPALVAEGHTLHGCTDGTGRLIRIPAEVRDVLLASPD